MSNIYILFASIYYAQLLLYLLFFFNFLFYF